MASGLLLKLNLYGAESRTRTDDLLITNQLLYQLSYFGLPFEIVSLPRPPVKPNL